MEVHNEKNKILNTSLIVGLITVTSSLFLGCSKTSEGNLNNSVTESVGDNVSVVDNNEETKLQENTNSTSTFTNKNDYYYNLVYPSFEEIYANDTEKELKLSFAKKSLNTMDAIVDLLPKELKNNLFSSDGIIVRDGPSYEFNIMTSSNKDKSSFNKNDNFYSYSSDVYFDDNEKYLFCEARTKMSFELYNDTEIILDSNAKNILNYLVPDIGADVIEAKINESLSSGGKSIYLIEEKNRNLTISSYVSEGATYAQISYEERKDY